MRRLNFVAAILDENPLADVMSCESKISRCRTGCEPTGCDLSAGDFREPCAVPGRIAFLPSCFATLDLNPPNGGR